MKISRTFSVDMSLADSFERACADKQLNKNAVVSRFMKEFVEEHSLGNIKMIPCAICGAIYSEKLNQCPQCKLKDTLEDKQNQLQNLYAKRDKLKKWLEEGKAQPLELEVVENEIVKLEGELND